MIPKQTKEQAMATIKEYRPHQYIILLLRDQGLSYEDIGKALNCKPQTAKTRASRARENLSMLMNGVMPFMFKEYTNKVKNN